MEKINQFISFVIVADNDAEYINDFITSLSLTSERITDYEIIIIDNSSTDNTNAIVDNLCDNDGLRIASILNLPIKCHMILHHGLEWKIQLEIMFYYRSKTRFDKYSR